MLAFLAVTAAALQFRQLCLAVHAGLEAWKVAPVAPAAELRRTPALLTRLAPAAHVEDGQPPRILRSPLVDGELPPRLRAGYRQETLVLDAPGRWGVAAVPGFEGWRSCAFADLWPAAAGMRLDVFQTLYAIDAVALPRDVCAVPRAERPGRRRPRAAHARHRRGGRPRDAFGWTLVRSEGIRPRAFVAPRWRWAAPAAALPAVLDPARGEDAGLVVVSGDGADPSPPEREALPLGACTIEGYRPERVALSCTSRADGHAVLVEENAPGWTATADGAPAPVLTADVLLRAVRVGPGRHAVVFLLPHAVAPRGRRRVRRRVARLDRAGGPRWGAPGPRERRR